MAKKRKPRAASRAGRASTVKVWERICNVEPSKGTERDFDFQDSIAGGALGAVAAPPASMDLRKPWWTINDQEDTGSCVGWATADGVVRYHMVKANRLPKAQLLSPRFVWMASKETDEYTTRADTFLEGAGTSLKAAMDIVRKFGAVKETLLPFHIVTKMHVGEENAFYTEAAQRKVSAYFNLRRNLNQWKSWLATNGPIHRAQQLGHRLGRRRIRVRHACLHRGRILRRVLRSDAVDMRGGIAGDHAWPR